MRVDSDGWQLNNNIALDDNMALSALVCGEDTAVASYGNGVYVGIDITNPTSLSFSDIAFSSIYGIAGTYLPPSSFFFFQPFSSSLYEAISSRYYYLPVSTGIVLQYTIINIVLIFFPALASITSNQRYQKIYLSDQINVLYTDNLTGMYSENHIQLSSLNIFALLDCVSDCNDNTLLPYIFPSTLVSDPIFPYLYVSYNVVNYISLIDPGISHCVIIELYS
jgi:hypothetical protein